MTDEKPPSLGEKLKAMLGTAAGRRQARKIALSRSFTRFLARRPMFTAPFNKPRTERHEVQLDKLAEWEEGMKSWRDGWAKAREDSDTFRYKTRLPVNTRAHRRERSADKRKAKRAARVQENLARLAAAVNATFGSP